MEKKLHLISLNSSGESLEKCVSLYYSTIKTNDSFYSDYEVILFFGHNLPKRTHAPIHGTILFYQKYLSGISVIPCFEWEFLFEKRNEILNFLLFKGVVQGRNISRLELDDELFRKFVKYLPVDTLYPKFYERIIQDVSSFLGVYKICPLYMERNFMYIPQMVREDYNRYKIYFLNKNGDVGSLSLRQELVEQTHKLYNCLKNNAVLSSNSALFLSQINHRLKHNHKLVIGYRPHRGNLRLNREYELQRLLANNINIIEPENKYIKGYFERVMRNTVKNEDDVYALIFKEYLGTFYDESFICPKESWM